MKQPMASTSRDQVAERRWVNARTAGDGLVDGSHAREIRAAFDQLAAAAPGPLALWLRWVAVFMPQFMLIAGDALDEPDAFHRLADHAEDAAVAQQASRHETTACSSAWALADLAREWRRMAEMFEAVEALKAGLPRAESAADVQRLVRRVVEACPSATATVDRMSLDLFEVQQ